MRLAAAVLLVAACAAAPTTSTMAGTTTTTIASTTTQATTTTTGEPLDWTGDFSFDLGGGYALGPCEGDAPIVCVSKDGWVIGTVEYITYDATTFDYLAGVEDPMESVALLASNYLDTFAADRTTSCPALRFAVIEPQPATVTGVPGVVFGFAEFDGEIEVERNLLFAARQVDLINLVNAGALDEGACVSAEGATLLPSDLEAIRPGLEAAIASASFDAR
jgi:hypothetical protein